MGAFANSANDAFSLIYIKEIDERIMLQITYLVFFRLHIHGLKHILIHHLLVFHNRHNICLVVSLDLIVVCAFDGSHGRRRHIFIR